LQCGDCSSLLTCYDATLEECHHLDESICDERQRDYDSEFNCNDSKAMHPEQSPGFYLVVAVYCPFLDEWPPS
jgi:hypothetical protein